MNDSTQIHEAWISYKNKLLQFIRSKVSSKEDAEDILSLAFEKLILQGASAALPKEIVPWLYRVVRNSIVDYYRVPIKFAEIADDFALEATGIDTFEALSECLAPMVGLLPEPYNTIVKMSDIDGLKNKQIAAKLDLSLSAVKSQIRRGRQKLYQKLIICCEIQRNENDSVVGFEQKLTQYCGNCGE